MKFNIQNIDKKSNLHHFNIIEGGDVVDVNTVCSKILNFNHLGNKNYFYERFDNFKVDDSRRLIDLQNFKHKNDDVAVYVIDCAAINISAQNSLLKIFEETAVGNYFFFLIPDAKKLLPTFLSRAEIFKNNSQQNLLPQLDYFNLKESSIKKRLEIVDKITTDLKKERINKSEINISVNYLLNQINNQIIEGNKELIHQLDIISDASHYINDSGSSVKNILEFIVLTI